MSVAINSNGELSASELNRYLGAAAPYTSQLSFNGVGSAPNYSLNQIFFSSVGTETPPTSFSVGNLRGKRFAIYQNANRNTLHGGTYITEGDFALPIFIGYFGFGTSGILNPYNRGMPLAISIKSSGDIVVAAKAGDGFTWNEIPVLGGQAIITSTTYDAIRILGGGGRFEPSGDTNVTLSVAPSLSGSAPLVLDSRGDPTGALDIRGAHTINITFKGGDIRNPPFDEGPLDPPPINEGLEGIR